MYKYSPVDEDHVRIYGRCIKKEPLALFWTASGVEFDTDSTECHIDIECDYTIKEMWLRVELDGFLVQRFLVPVGRNRYCLYRGFPEGELKTVRVVIEAQPMDDDPKRRLLIHEIITDRVLQPMVPKAHRIEFVGDSLTSGEGLTGTADIHEWCTGIFGLTGHYGLKVAKYFDAEYSIVSQSGWGVYCGWDNCIYSNIPAHYTQVCGVLKNEENIELGSLNDWDFASWQPDVIVVNLGTNDGGCTEQPAWTDPDTGIAHKQAQITADGWETESEARFENAVYDFLILLRKCNPGSYIIWAYGMCGPLMEPYIKAALKRYIADSSDGRICYVSLPQCPDDECGSHFHPGVKNHAEAADVIIGRIKELGLM